MRVAMLRRVRIDHHPADRIFHLMGVVSVIVMMRMIVLRHVRLLRYIP
jgi:hypothetical protein